MSQYTPIGGPAESEEATSVVRMMFFYLVVFW
jgi:hypothetical protein